MDIRNYLDRDHTECLAVFDSNFSVAVVQRQEFEAFLQDAQRQMFVVEHGGQIIGCGGFTAGGTEARLQWGIVRRDMQRQGLGRYLLLYRLKAIGNLPGIQFVHAIVPSPLTRFYEKSGLKLQREGDGLAEMRMKMQVCTA
jgi:N-acetylglutamate synthase-like GNAT family acetyltransferase